MIFLKLFFTFLEIGIFGFGGGYGMLSLVQSLLVTQNHWLTSAEFANIVAVSQVTPGPIGINAATYCGYTAVHNAGMGEWMCMLGSGVATLALVLPSFVIMIVVCRLFLKYMDTQLVQSVMSGLRLAVVGLVAAAALMLMNRDNFSTPSIDSWQFWVSIYIFFATFIGTRIMKINPIRMLGWAALAGLLTL